MKIQRRPWLIASSVGTAIQVLIGLGLSWGYSQLLPVLVEQSNAAQIGQLSLMMSALRLCLCGSVFGLLVGVGYAQALPRDEYFSRTEGAVGGAVSALTASATTSVLGWLIGLASLVLFTAPYLGDAPTQMLTLIVSQTASAVGGGLVAAILSLVVGAAGGAVGIRRER